MYKRQAINRQASEEIVRKAEKFLGKVENKRIAVLGLSFKPDTDDMREAPSLIVINSLKKKGAQISAYDPIAMDNAKGIVKDIEYANDAYNAARDAELVIIMTEWNEFKELDLSKLKSHMKGNFMVDGRNIYDPIQAEKVGFSYTGVGR